MNRTSSPSPLADALRATMPAMGALAFLSVFVNLALLVLPLYSLQVYDRVLSSRNLVTLAMLTLIAVAFLLLHGLLEYVRSGILVRAGARFDEKLSDRLFDRSCAAERAGRAGAAHSAMKDADTIREAISSGTIASLLDVPWTLVFIALCFGLHAWLGMVALAGVLVIMGLALATEAVTRTGLGRASRLAADASGILAAAARNAEAVRGLGMGGAVRGRWREAQAGMIAALSSASEGAGLMLALSKASRLAVQLALLAAGAWLAIKGSISPGVMIAASIMMGRALAPVEQVVAGWRRLVAFRDARARLETLFAAVRGDPQPMPLPDPIGELRIEGLRVAAQDGRLLLHGIGFALKTGESLAVVGASGSGKSTLARALAGVWPAAAGAVRLDGASLAQWHPDLLGRHIGYLPQDIQLFAGTVADNIARLGPIDQAKVVAAAQAAEAHDAILRLPQGYDTQIGDGGSALSGGMRQRVGLARALYGDPCLIILDEPNAHLDQEGDAGLARAMAALKASGRTLVVVTHKPQLLRHVDHVLVLAEGRIQAFGPRDSVVARLASPRPVSPSGALAANGERSWTGQSAARIEAVAP